MSRNRYSKRADNNQNDIVEALEEIPGVSVAKEHDDLLVGFKGLTYWYEVKNPKRAANKKGKVYKSEKKKSQIELEKNWKGLAAGLGAQFAAAAAKNDADNTFIHDNYDALREQALFKLCIPQALGGSGAAYAEVAAVIRELGSHCGSVMP